MEIDDYLRLTFRHWRLIAAVICLGLAVGLAVSWLTPVTYDAAVNLTVERVNPKATADYQYDGYYVQQSTDDLAQTIVSWLGTPAVLVDIYQTAGWGLSVRSLDEVSRVFQAKKYSKQNVGLRINDRSEATAEKLAEAAAKTIEQRVSQINLDPDGKPMFAVTSTKPVVMSRQPSWLIGGGLGLIVGLLIGLALAFSIEVVKGQGRGDRA